MPRNHSSLPAPGFPVLRPATLAALAVLAAAVAVPARTFHVAPGGSDAGAGNAAQPWASIAKAVTGAAAGDTILLEGGAFRLGATLALSQSGRADARIRLQAAPGQKPVLDFSGQPYGADHRGLLLTGDYWLIQGLEVTRAGDNGLKVEGSHNRIEACVFHHNGDSGVQLGFAHETENPGGTMCSFNEIINCDAYLNFDFDNAGSDADGFACKMHNGKGNVFRGCRAWRNSDDGWDLFETDWPVEIHDCWTWHNGDKADFDAAYQEKMGKPMSSFQGNGNGFKLGGNGTGGSSRGTHVARRCVAFDNAFRSRKGFDQNSHKGGVVVEHCLAFGNGYNYMFEDNAESGASNAFRNNVSFGVKGGLDHEFAAGAVSRNNSWDLGLAVTAADFLGLSEEWAKAPRAPNGSLPANGFARLSSGSGLIDKGADLGMPFAGRAPDLGAFESGGPTSLAGVLAGAPSRPFRAGDAARNLLGARARGAASVLSVKDGRLTLPGLPANCARRREDRR